MQNNNLVGLVAVLTEKPRIILEAPEWERKQYEAKVKAPRRSGVIDEIVVRMPATAIGLKKAPQQLKEGKEILIVGSIGSENVNTEDKRKQRVKIFVLASSVIINEPPAEQQNSIYIEGNICKLPLHRKTPKKKIDITEMIIAVNNNGKSAFVPVICWGNMAVFAKTLRVGQPVKIKGRLQSRRYVKVIDGEKHTMTAYEVTAKELGYIEEGIEKRILEETNAGAAQSAPDGATQEASKRLQEYGA